jgi:hypothetical protein
MGKELKEARKIALEQYRNHAAQVSGAWSINGREFCEQYGLDYEAARTASHEGFVEDLDYEYRDTLADMQRKIGELSSEQREKLYAYIEDSSYEYEEGAYFWDAILQEIKEKEG